MKLSIKLLSPPTVISKRLVKAFERVRTASQPKIAALIIDHVSEKADKAFGSMAPLYTKALRDPRTITISPEAITIQLRDPIARALDSGSSAFDLKKKLLANATKHSRDGKPYVDVPFQHKASTISGWSRTRMALSATLSTSESVRNSVVTPGAVFDRQLMKRGKPSTTQHVNHKRGIRDDLIRSSTKTSAKKSSVSYSTIRRISARSSSTSWWHPGFRGKNLLRGAVDALKKDILQIMRDSLRMEGFEK
jgi:hypothetical protein